MAASPPSRRAAAGRCREVDAGTFDRLFLERRPLLDLRAPVEFAQGAFPGAVNLPLLDDDERHRVGLRYKQAGQEAAVRLGHQLVGGQVKAARVAAWARWAAAHPDGVLYCFRGGRRSHIVRDWLAEVGREVPLVAGGYKALRRHLVARLTELGDRLPLLVIAGRTGTGKTRILERLDRQLDLEGLAHHRGSAFGTRVAGQPPPIDFENATAVRLLELAAAGTARPVAVEDESRNVGRLSVPEALFANMSRSPLALIEAPVTQRVEVILEDYVLGGLVEHRAAYGAAGEAHFRDYLLGALAKISKRLGGVRHREIEALMAAALDAHLEHGDLDGHRAWIRRMLDDYYDPMYDHQLRGKAARIAFRGDAEAVTAWLRERVDRPRERR